MDETIYERVSEFFEKENRRIGSRISWLFATQTLIFGAFEYVNKYDEEFRTQLLSAIRLSLPVLLREPQASHAVARPGPWNWACQSTNAL